MGKLNLLEIDDADLPRIFWQDQEQSLSFGELRSRAEALSPVLAKVPKSSILAIQAQSPLELWTLMLAAWSRGITVLPLAQNASEASIEVALSQLPWTARLNCEDDGSHQFLSNPLPPLPSDSDVFIMTSGSSGAPKAIAHSLESLAASARETLKFYGWNKGDSWLLSLDPSHIGGLQILMRTWLGRGIVYYAGLPKDIGSIVSERSFEFLSLVPTQLFRLLENPDSAASLRRAKAILLGGAQTQDSLRQELEKLDLPISITYGSSETASQISAFKVGELPDTKEEVGEILPHWKLTTNEDKDLWIEGPALMQGYWQSMLWHGVNEGRYQLSDRGEIYGLSLVLEGRRDQIFQVAGENLSPMEILSRLEALYPLSDLQLHKIANAEYGFVPRLVIRSRNKPDLLSIHKAFESLQPIKRPREIWWFVSDEVSKLSLVDIEQRLSLGDDHLQRLWTYEKI